MIDRSRFWLLLFALLAISGLAFADADPPGRVVRLQYMQGQVSLQPGGVDDWVAGTLNRPLTTADRVWTDRDSRAELSLATAALRMNGETSITLTNVADNTLQIEMDQGILNLDVRFLNSGEVIEVDTPNFAFTVMKPGEYRFDVLPNEDQSWVTVRRGEGAVTGQGEAVRVRGNERVRFTGGQSLSHTSSGAPDRDPFDQWCAVREKRATSAAAGRYVAPGTVGYEDLDDYGRWEVAPTYGRIWVPAVSAGWAPYRYGHWAWVEPWGWTWVDDAPWGFAPFHYGRWVYYNNYWGWVPGPYGVRPVYAPALVAWVGGGNWGVSFGFGPSAVGWFPLGWRDPFIPCYHASPAYWRSVNISNTRVVNVTTINNYYINNSRNVRIDNIRYENQHINGAVTGFPGDRLRAGQPIGRSGIVVPSRDLGNAQVMTAPGVAPTREAVLGGRAAVAAPRVVNRPVVSRMAPPSRPVSFDQQRPLLEHNNGAPLSAEQRAGLRSSAPQMRPGAGVQSNVGRPADVPAARGDARGVPNASAPAPAANAPGRSVPRPPSAGGAEPWNRGGMNSNVSRGASAPSEVRQPGYTGTPATAAPSPRTTTDVARPSGPTVHRPPVGYVPRASAPVTEAGRPNANSTPTPGYRGGNAPAVNNPGDRATGNAGVPVPGNRGNAPSASAPTPGYRGGNVPSVNAPGRTSTPDAGRPPAQAPSAPPRMQANPAESRGPDAPAPRGDAGQQAAPRQPDAGQGRPQAQPRSERPQRESAPRPDRSREDRKGASNYYGGNSPYSGAASDGGYARVGYGGFSRGTGHSTNAAGYGRSYSSASSYAGGRSYGNRSMAAPTVQRGGGFSAPSNGGSYGRSGGNVHVGGGHVRNRA